MNERLTMRLDWIGGGRWLLALGLLCLGLGAIVAVELTASTNFEPPAAGAASTPAPTASPGPRTVVEFAPPPLAQFAETVERPLFSESRRPPEQTADSSGPPKPFEGTLVGVLIGQTETVALLKIAGETDVTRVTKGQTIRGWLVVEIHPDRVVLQGERTAEIRLQDDAAEGAPRPGGPGIAAPGQPDGPRLRRPTPGQPSAAPPAQPRR